MGKITVFTDCSSDCTKAKDLLKQKGADFEEISLLAKPEWRHYMYLLTNGERVFSFFVFLNTAVSLCTLRVQCLLQSVEIGRFNTPLACGTY